MPTYHPFAGTTLMNGSTNLQVKRQMMRLSKAEVQRRLAVGTVFVGEFIRKDFQGNPENKLATRKVVSQTSHQMVSEFVDGPKAGQKIYLTWAHTCAREEDNAIILTMTDTNPPKDFLKISIQPVE